MGGIQKNFEQASKDSSGHVRAVDTEPNTAAKGIYEDIGEFSLHCSVQLSIAYLSKDQSMQ